MRKLSAFEIGGIRVEWKAVGTRSRDSAQNHVVTWKIDQHKCWAALPTAKVGLETDNDDFASYRFARESVLFGRIPVARESLRRSEQIIELTPRRLVFNRTAKS